MEKVIPGRRHQPLLVTMGQLTSRMANHDLTVGQRWGKFKSRIIVYLLFLCLTMISLPRFAASETLDLCVDERNWYPFLYVSDQGQVRGIHVDIVAKALTSIGHDFQISAYPRRQCIDRVINKEADGMISIAYNPDIASFFTFPPEAALPGRSKWRIMQVDYMVVTHRSSNYRFKGDARTLPDPIRVPHGETIASELRLEGRRVDDGAKDDRRNFLKLLRDKNGSVITTSVMAERIIKEHDLSDQITIHSIPFNSQSYYLAFNNHQRISHADREKLWNEIIKWRNDFVFMLQLFAKY